MIPCFIVHSLADLEAEGLRRWAKHDKLEIQIPNLDITESAYWTVRVNRYRRACGCEVGAAACGLALIVFVLFAVFQNDRIQGGLISWIVLGFTFVVLAGVIGKGLGLLYARYRLLRTISALRTRLSHKSANAATRPGF
jgi:hypothetical protein